MHQESEMEPDESVVEPQAVEENQGGSGAPVQPVDAAPEDPMIKLQAELEAVRGELAQSKDRYMRVLAEMENSRKRMDKEKSDLLKYSQEKLIQDILPVLDSCDKALAAGGSTPDTTAVSPDNVVEGVKLVFKQLSSALERHGLKVIESIDKPFDPNLHQAVQRKEMDNIKEDTVVQEYSKGYLLNERLIRPAMVVVATAKD